MNKKINKIFSGYIEGYYGKLLSWHDRLNILINLKKNFMNFYFYAPKEDKEHRFKWKKPYSKIWLKKFSAFTSKADSYEISIIAGIAPGLNYDFSSEIRNNDFEILKFKCKQLINSGASFVALMFDDIPNNFNTIYGTKIIEGASHAKLANMLADELKTTIFVVPRIYARELNNESPDYLCQFGKYLQKDILVFHCGNNIVSKNINQRNRNSLKSVLNNDLIFWDNIFANDYCPRRLFIHPWHNRKLESIMINPTGMIETDLLLLDIVASNQKSTNLNLSFLKTLGQHNVPKEFNKIMHYFENPVFNFRNEVKELSFKEDIKIIDHLLWEWKSKLYLEWYPYLMGLKHDILIKNNKLHRNRIIKTQNKPLRNKLLKAVIN